MIVMTVRAKRVRGIAILVIFIILAIFAAKFIFSASSGIILNDESERLCFLSDNGLTPAGIEISPKEVIVPSEFNNTYLEYNELQKKQEFNLEKYKGITVTLYCYQIVNYEDKQNAYATLIMDGNKLIGADISLKGDNMIKELIKGDNQNGRKV